MDISEKLVTAMMQRELDTDTGEQLLEIHLRVCREINCSQCGYTMDTLKAVLITVRNTKINEDLGRFVICGNCWDKQREGMEAITSDFITHIPTDFRDYDSNLQLKKNAPPVKTPKVANIRARNGDLKQVIYSRRFTEHGFNWFLHRETRSDYWSLSNWETGYSAGGYRTQGECRDRIKALTPEDINLIKGAVSLHGDANPSVKKGGKS